MKIEACSFSGYKIYPGHGKRIVKADGKVYIFLNAKAEAAHLMRRNPRKITWTVLYRRKHRKGIEEELQKKRTRRTTKFQRAIVGASLNDILAKRNMKPEVRKAQREQAIRYVLRVCGGGGPHEWHRFDRYLIGSCERETEGSEDPEEGIVTSREGWKGKGGPKSSQTYDDESAQSWRKEIIETFACFSLFNKFVAKFWQSWAMIFAASEYTVSLYDVIGENVDKALVSIESQLKNLEAKGLLRGQISAKQQFALISKANTLKDCLHNAIHVQECVFEDLELKRKVFKELDEIASDDVVLCSSTSCILPSLFQSDLKHRRQAIVGHPVNPPYTIPLVEVVPNKYTDEEVVKRTRALFTAVGQKPVVLKKEVNGFIGNRIQYAILSETYRLIEEEVISVEDVDTVMADGFGLRWALMGPWETAHLNAQGMKEYFEKYAKSMNSVCQDFGAVPSFEGKGADIITKEMHKRIPVEDLPQRRRWRDERLIALTQLKKKLDP
ncbi:unnamed protein product [Medioppia subpectinata]|uniref:Large ribosomal subunit protein eL24 n=1 Tax=Medioppia subpectinata TaxID=1979941 RepID=A0A7R9Q351_9ACAR|nr:unnamed protein product [Medioppia subpectinata]CAG2110918.1 unnamed protein product [Medioppia subpectinata]